MKLLILVLYSILFLPFLRGFASPTLNDLNYGFEKGFDNPTFQMNEDEFEKIERQVDLLFRQYEKQGAINPSQIRNVVQKLFLDGRLQEGIWTLDILGLVAEAEWFAQKLEHSLKAGPLILRQEIGKGVTQSRWGLIQNFPVIVKPEDTDWNGSRDAEVWAYHLDRILGLNLVATSVPMAVGGAPFSVQAAILGARESGLNFRDHGYHPVYPEVFILDFLIGSTDRHSHNSLFSPIGFLVAIDNGRSGAVKQYQAASHFWWSRYDHYKFDRLPRKDVVDNIATLNIDDFKAEFIRYAPQEIVQFVANKLQILKKDFAKKIQTSRTRFIQREERLRALAIPDHEIEANFHSITKAAKIRRKQLTSAFYKILNEIDKELPILDFRKDHRRYYIHDIKLSENAHVVRYYLEFNRETLTPKQMNNFMQSIYELYVKEKILKEDVPVLMGILLRMKPVQTNNLKYLMLLTADNDSFRSVLENTRAEESFRTILEYTQIGRENLVKILDWRSQFTKKPQGCQAALQRSQ